MKNTAFLAVLLILCAGSTAQKSSPTLDHVAIYVRDLETSKHFYSELFHFDTLPHPVIRAFKFVWYSIGDHVALHMIEGLKDTVSLPFMIHYCYSVADLDAFMQLLDRLNIPYFSGPDRNRGTRMREDGVKQLFIKDPDMYWVEVNDAKH